MRAPSRAKRCRAKRKPGAEVYSGTLNGNGLLRIQVTRAGAETTLSRVVALVEEAREQRAPVERLADRYARYFLPALLLAAALTFYFTGDWLRTVAVLIVACPCALILATPTAMVSAIGGLARRGILVRGGTVLQQAAKVDTVVFDKTGTITSGEFEIVRVIALAGTETDVIRLAAAAESGSDHVLARVIAAEAARRGVKRPAWNTATSFPGVARNVRLMAGPFAQEARRFWLSTESRERTHCSKQPIAWARPRCWWPMRTSWPGRSCCAIAFAKASSRRSRS